jgi:hypothetical protein
MFEPALNAMYHGVMPWRIERVESTLRVQLEAPMALEDWDAVFEEIHGALGNPKPAAIVLPLFVPGGSDIDPDMLASLWEALQAVGIPIMREPPTDP